MRWIKLIAIVFVCLIGIVVFGSWALLSSSVFAKTRGDMAARFIGDKIGQPVQVDGGVWVNLGSDLHIKAEGVSLPAGSSGEVLVNVGRVEFDIAARDLMSGQIDPSGLMLDGVKVFLSVDKDGNSSWSAIGGNPREGGTDDKSAANAPPGPGQSNDSGVFSFLSGRQIELSNSGVVYQDARNGLDLELELSSLNVGRDNSSSPLQFDGEGELNGEKVALTGTFPQAEPFNVAATFSQMNLLLDGAPDDGGYAKGFSADVSLEIAELGQLLDVLKLQKSVSGNGRIGAVFSSSQGKSHIEDLIVEVALDGGQSVKVTGDIGELGNPSDVSIETSIRLYPESAEPPSTRLRRDLKLIGVDMSLIAQPNGIPKRGMVVKTNGFTLDTSGEGPPPIAVSKVYRTADGLLQLGQVELRIGPPSAPFLVLDGSVADALRLEGIEADATLDLPAASLLAPTVFQDSDALGKIVGGYHLSGNAKVLSIAHVNAKTVGTDLWQLNVTGSVHNALSFSDVSLDVTAEVASAADLLEALDLKPIGAGPVKLTAKVTSEGTDWKATAGIESAESKVTLITDLDANVEHPMVRGRIESDLIRIEHLRDIIAASIELAKLNDREKELNQEATEPDPANDVQPLVLNKPVPEIADDDSDIGENDLLRDVTLHPLGQGFLLSGMDLGVTIDLRNIEGPKGASSLKSELVMKDRQAQLGPVTFEYGGAHFDINGSMDLINEPQILNISGSTGGWDFGKIMHELRFEKRASGTVDASFDISGKHTSVRDFLGSMDGSATVSMRNGTIDTNLLDLAGLGIVPWLFTKEPGKTAHIVCLRAPLHLSNGDISTKKTVVETDQVQVVVLGNVNLGKKTLNVSGQPRRIGKPLSRSPWPFTVAGPFSKPKVKVKDGPKRVRRSDGASIMPQKRRLCVPDIMQLHKGRGK